MASILVVDDNEMNRDMLSRRLGKRGYEVMVAEGGAEALELVSEHRFDLVLLDIMMPGMDGCEVLERLRATHDPARLPVIMATARTESEDVVRALKMGANDYVTKPFDFPVVLARVGTQVELKRSRDELDRAHRRMKKDLEAAAKVQQTLLPAGSPEIEGARCVWRYLPCDELAGDTLNVVPLEPGRTGLFLLDVSGHGVPAALLSVTLTRLISDASPESSVLRVRDPQTGLARLASPAEVATELARRFPYDDETHQYFTMVYGVLDAGRRRFTFTSAGHTPVLHLRRDGRTALHGSTGAPVALIPPALAPSSYGEVVIALEDGDRIYLMSDGIPEAASPGGEEFGMDRVAGILRGALEKDLEGSLGALLEAVETWTEGGGPDDDVSLLALEIGP